MSRLSLFVFFMVLVLQASAQNLYLRTYGDSAKPAIIFLHGGPGYNSASFEGTTAQPLADLGFYVVVYDRRGEGRSSHLSANYSFQESIDDLNFIYDSLNITKSSLIGHSFGGVIGTKFTQAEQEKVDALVLVGAPVNLQETFRTILNSCREIYKADKKHQELMFLESLASSDTSTIIYSSSCFGLAMQNGFYSPKKPTRAAKKINKRFKKTEFYQTALKMERAGPMGFMRNENYINIDLSNDIMDLVASKINVYGLYGKEDGLYSKAQFDRLNELINGNAVYLDRCSHSVFIDQQATFLHHISNWCN